MDKIVKKFDYVKATEEEENALQDQLQSLDLDELSQKMKVADLKNISETFKKKICIKEFNEKVPRYSPGTWMSRKTAQIFCDLIE